MKLRIMLVAALGIAGITAMGTAQAQGNSAEVRASAHLKGNVTVSDGDRFMARSTIVDADGTEHVRMDREYKGLRVIGGDVVVHSHPARGLKGISHTLKVSHSLSTSAAVDESLAISVAEAGFSGARDGSSSSQLVVYARGAQPVLAYEVVVNGTQFNQTPSSMHFVIDANSGTVLDKWDEVMTAAATGTGNSLLAGQVSIGTDSQTGGFAMRDPLRGNHYTSNLKNRTNGTGTLFTDVDNIWGNSLTSDVTTVGVDAHWGQRITWDYYKNVHGRNGIANDGRGAYSRVHYGRNYVNAFWSDSCFCMTYGDGDGVTYYPLVALDVAGHEMSHGVTAATAKLVYSGESGGLNEGNSDIFGTMVEYYANNAASNPNYLIGERIYVSNKGKTTPTKALRYMFKPSIDGASPDCYVSNIGTLDVHYSSGVTNHFFYLLAEGATVPAGFNLTPSQLVCNGNTGIAGVGRDAAAKIWYRALTVYMTSNTNYAGARAATLSAAADLYGSGSATYATVAAAWSAVSVN